MCIYDGTKLKRRAAKELLLQFRRRSKYLLPCLIISNLLGIWQNTMKLMCQGLTKFEKVSFSA